MFHLEQTDRETYIQDGVRFLLFNKNYELSFITPFLFCIFALSFVEVFKKVSLDGGAEPPTSTNSLEFRPLYVG